MMYHTDLDAKKTVVGAPKRDGVEAHRLLTRQYDLFSYDVAAQKLENILVVGRANPKNIDQLDQVFKELYKRMHEYEARAGPLGDDRTMTLPIMIMIVADPTTKAHFRKEVCTTDLDRMRREVEGLRDLYKPTRAVVPLGPSVMGDGKGWAAPSGDDPDGGCTQDEWDA